MQYNLRPEKYLSRKRTRKLAIPMNHKSKNTLDRDLTAMNKVISMLREGTIRWIGEIGRRY